MTLCCLKVCTKILGVAQAIIGVVIFIIGIANKNSDTVSDSSGVTYWGPISFICSGILSAFAGDRCHAFLTKVSMVMNLFSTGGGVAASGLFSADLNKLLHEMKNLSIQHFNPFEESTGGKSGALLVFSLLEVCVAIWTFVRIWRS